MTNYGPIERLDITLPIDDEGPKPVVLVGENGSGKSVSLSHIVNGLMLAQQSAYRETPEVELGKVYKFRSPQYVTSGKEFSFARVDFEDDFWLGELQLNRPKEEFDTPPNGTLEGDAQSLWKSMRRRDSSYMNPEAFNDRFRVAQLFQRNCVLYFPPDRFEDPAWLNEINLSSKASHLDLSHLEGHTDRKIISHSPLGDNRNWLFDLVYDMRVFELQTSNVPVDFPTPGGQTRRNVLPVLRGYSGTAKSFYDVVLQVVRLVIGGNSNLRLGIGPRKNRVVTVETGDETVVPNIFQLSSGEVSLLNIFLSILRDYDLAEGRFKQAKDVSGTVVVDEIDLHLHAHHQYEILPKLMKMFPKVQFVVTSHSPLFVLGLQRVVGEDGFRLYRLPKGESISPEEFSEFGAAYQALANTRRHSDEIRDAVREARKPLIFVDGKTDVKYHERAAKLLGFDSLLVEAEFRDGGGNKKSNIWKGLTSDHVERQKVIVLHDPEEGVQADARANVYRRKIELIKSHPLKGEWKICLLRIPWRKL